MIINNDVKAMMATRACAEALSMYIVHIVSQQPAIPLGRQASIDTSLLRDLPFAI